MPEPDFDAMADKVYGGSAQQAQTASAPPPVAPPITTTPPSKAPDFDAMADKVYGGASPAQQALDMQKSMADLRNNQPYSPFRQSAQGFHDMSTDISNMLGLPAYKPTPIQPMENPGDLYKNIVRDARATVAGVGARVTRSLPSYVPGKGIDLPKQGPFEASDIPLAGQIAKGIVAEPFQRYIRPIMEGDPASVGRNITQQPYTTALDALAFAPGATIKVAKGIGKVAGKGVGLAGTTAAKAAGGVVSKSPRLQHYLNAVQGESQGVKVFHDYLTKLGTEQRQALHGRREILFRAFERIPKNLQRWVSIATDYTDPKFAHVLKDPAVQHYVKIAENYGKQVRAQLIKRKLITKFDVKTIQYGPEFMAQARKHGWEFSTKDGKTIVSDFTDPRWHQDPAHFTMLRAEHLHTSPEVKQAFEAFVAADKKQRFANHLVFAREADRHFSLPEGAHAMGVVPRPFNETLKAAATAQRSAAMLKKNPIYSKTVTTVFEQHHELNNVKALIYKMETSERFMQMMDALEDFTKVLNGLPQHQQIPAAREMMKHLAALFEEAGIPPERAAQYEQLANVVHNYDKQIAGTWEKAVRDIARGAEQVAHSKAWLPYHWMASAQRVASVIGDPFLPFVVFGQSVANLATARVNGPKSFFNALLSAHLAMNPKVMAKLPKDLLEYREPMGIHSSNPVIQLFAKWQGTAINAQNGIRATHALSRMAEEWERAAPPVRSLFMQALKGTIRLDQMAARMERNVLKNALKAKRAAAGGYTKKFSPAGQQKALLLGSKSHQEWVAFGKALHKEVNDVHGHYTKVWRGYGKVLQSSSIWANYVLHSYTQLAHAMAHNPYKMFAMRQIAAQIGDMQRVAAAADQEIPDWAAEEGAWRLDRMAPVGDIVVQFDPQWSLATGAVQMPLQAYQFGHNSLVALGIVPKPAPGEEESGGSLPPMNFFIQAPMVFAGLTPGGGRRLMNPYQKSVTLEQGVNAGPYDILKLARQKGLPNPQDTESSPFMGGLGGLAHRATLSAELGFSPKLMSTAKNWEGALTGTEASDLTAIGPGMSFPKVDLKAGEMRSAKAIYPGTPFIGGAKVSPSTIRAQTKEGREMQERAKQPAGFRRKLGRSVEMKLLQPTQQMRKILRSVKGELLPKP